MSEEKGGAAHPMQYRPRDQEFQPLSEEQRTFELWNRLFVPYSKHFLPALKPVYSVIASRAASLLQGIDLPKILDVGASAGEPAMTIAKMLKESTVLSTDITTRSVVAGNARAQQSNVSNIDFISCNADELIFDGESFDLATCSFLLPYVDVNRVAQELFRVLKIGGKLIIVEFANEDADTLRPLLTVLDELIPDRKQLPPKHGLFPDRLSNEAESLKAELEKAGFEKIAYEKIDIGFDLVVSVDEAWEMYRDYIEGLIRHQNREGAPVAKEIFLKHLEDRKLIQDNQVSIWQENRILLLEANKPMKSWFQQLFE